MEKGKKVGKGRKEEKKSKSWASLFGHSPDKMAASFQRLQIVWRGITFKLKGGQKQRPAACQAGLKQFKLPGHFNSRMEEVYYFPQNSQWNKTLLSLQWTRAQNTGVNTGQNNLSRRTESMTNYAYNFRAKTELN